MSLEDYCESLNTRQKIQCCLALITVAMPIWNDFVKVNELKYRDSVVGLNHEIAPDILERGIKAVEIMQRKSILSKLFSVNPLSGSLDEFLEPITAMQDLDWELPYPVAQLFYSVYNLMRFADKKQSHSHKDLAYISMNQSIDALRCSELKSLDEVNAILDLYR